MHRIFVIIHRITTHSDGNRTLFLIIPCHCRRKIRINPCMRRYLRKAAYIRKILRLRITVYLSNICAVPRKCQRKLKGVRIQTASDSKNRLWRNSQKLSHSHFRLIFHRRLFVVCPQHPCQTLILALNFINLIEPHNLNRRNCQLFLKHSRSVTGISGQKQIKIRLRKLMVFIHCFTASKLADIFKAGALQNLIKLRVIGKRSKISHEIYSPGIFLPRLQKRVHSLTDIRHRRLFAVPGQRIHIARTDGDAHNLLRPSADTLHIRTEKRVNTGNTQHHNRGLLFP